jgi:hypothetical protein
MSKYNIGDTIKQHDAIATILDIEEDHYFYEYYTLRQEYLRIKGNMPISILDSNADTHLYTEAKPIIKFITCKEI